MALDYVFPTSLIVLGVLLLITGGDFLILKYVKKVAAKKLQQESGSKPIDEENRFK